MGYSEQDARRIGAWTPFVGVALAALTAGSLVVFSLVAQRTSLDGFSTRGVTAVAPSTETPSSITLPAGADAGAGVGDSDGSSSTTDVPALLTLTPASLLVATDGDTTLSLAEAGGDDGTIAADGSATNGRTFAAANDDVRASFSDAGGRASLFRALETEPGDDKRASGDREKAKGHKANAKDKKDRKHHGKGTRKAKGKKARKAKGKKARGHGRASAPKARSSHASNQSHPAPAARPARSSRPAPQPSPYKASKPSPPGHSNSSGKGHSKSRGRGHARD